MSLPLPTTRELNDFLAKATSVSPRAWAWGRYALASAAPLGGDADAPLVVDHLSGSDLLLAVLLRKDTKCARCGDLLPKGVHAFRLLTNGESRSDRFCEACRVAMVELGKMPGSDSQRRLRSKAGA